MFIYFMWNWKCFMNIQVCSFTIFILYMRSACFSSFFFFRFASSREIFYSGIQLKHDVLLTNSWWTWQWFHFFLLYAHCNYAAWDKIAWSGVKLCPNRRSRTRSKRWSWLYKIQNHLCNDWTVLFWFWVYYVLGTSFSTLNCWS